NTMKKILKIGAVLAVLGILAAIYVWFFVYNKPHRDYENATADYTLSAEAFYKHYANGSEESKKYLDKVIQVEGVPSSIETTDSTVIVAFAFGSGMFGDEGIRCTLLPNHHSQVKELDHSETISIKGHCTGYNGTDVIMEQCSLITK
ncbi:MAG: OB-fold putative lipoprotein, partial [Bacteroidetes bacterium]|nr:OB-fold putative lipoprotein [Bacteroidota bacterium]